MGYVYIVKNTVDDKVYIGSTIRELNRRINEHKSRARRKTKNYPLYKYMRNVGIDNFFIESVIKCDDKEKLYELELEYIGNYKNKDLLLNESLGIPISQVFDMVNDYKNGMILKDIGEKTGHCKKQISDIFKKFGVEIRDWNEEQKIKITKEELKDLYINKFMSTPEIAALYNTSSNTIGKHLHRHGIPVRKAINRKYLTCPPIK